MRKALTALAMLAISVLALGACGGTTQSAEGSSQQSLKHLLPAKYQSSGTIVVGSSVGYAPYEYFAPDGTTVLGIDPDFLTAMGTVLGVHFTVQQGAFATLIPGLVSGRYDALIAGLADTKTREQAIQFIDYLYSGSTFIVRKGNPDGINGPDDLCGKTVVVIRGSYQETLLRTQSSSCTSSGKGALNILLFDDDPTALVQVKSGRAVADFEDAAVSAYIAKTVDNGQTYQVAGPLLGKGYFGIAVGKDQTQLAKAFQAAIQKMVDDGKYAAILKKWNIEDGALSKIPLNAAGQS